MKKKTTNTPRINVAHRNAVMRSQTRQMLGDITLQGLTVENIAPDLTADEKEEIEDILISMPSLGEMATSFGHDKKTTAQLAIKARRRLL